MINIKTEYSLRGAFCHLDVVCDLIHQQGWEAAAIADEASTWGHVAWSKALTKRGVKPVFGVELSLVPDAAVRDKAVAKVSNPVIVIAKTQQGLSNLYRLVTQSTGQFYYRPRIDYSNLRDAGEGLAFILQHGFDWKQVVGECYLGIGPQTNRAWASTKPWKELGLPPVPIMDMRYATPDGRGAYDIIAGSHGRRHGPHPQHLLTPSEWLLACPWGDEALEVGQALLGECDAKIPQAEMVSPKFDKTLEQLCREAAPGRHIDLSDPVYEARLRREIDLIKEKGFDDYFYLIWDMIRFAKTKMLVGPARGSSCGSLVCYLLRITEVDPIPYSLLFERFIDLNRSDYPDIDIDFPDVKRDLVFAYLEQKYGKECVARLGTVNRYKAKSAVTEASMAMGIPKQDVDEFKDTIIERSSGDSRATSCILDSFVEVEAGRKLLELHPHIKVCADLEAHARHSGQHAAGVVVTNKPIHNYCSVDLQTGAVQIDKHDAEALDMLKIDALGLRTLTVIEDCLEAIGKDYDWLYDYPRDDQSAFDVLNQHRFSGIFQYEGYALQSIAKQMTIDCFEDVCAITALGRPGPFESGAAQEYVHRKNGDHDVTYIHPIIEAVTGVSFGLVIYQEQVMGVARNVGKLSWADVGFLRKAMSKSLGREVFEAYWQKFREGAMGNGLDEDTAKLIWDQINTMGSWSFNRSHAVAYGLVSYWTMLLKAHHPMEFAAACLRHAKSDDQAVLILRELVNEGYEYCPFDWERSQMNWAVVDGKLYGGFLGLKGVGSITAKKLMAKRKSGEALLPGESKKVLDPITPYDHAFAAHSLFKGLWEEPQEWRHILTSRLTEIGSINWDNPPRTVVVLVKMKARNQRSINDPKLVERRGGKVMGGQPFWLNTHVEDDTGQVMATISRDDYLRWGRPLIDDHKLGDWFLMKCGIKPKMQKLFVKRWRHMDPAEFVAKEGEESD
jgi:DNA polymerase III alpha subunit